MLDLEAGTSIAVAVPSPGIASVWEKLLPYEHTPLLPLLFTLAKSLDLTGCAGTPKSESSNAGMVVAGCRCRCSVIRGR